MHETITLMVLHGVTNVPPVRHLSEMLRGPLLVCLA